MQEQIKTPGTRESFHHRLVTKTGITFSNKQLSLLEKYHKYNLHKKKKNWAANLALEA
jgi:hypothetical protein